MKKYVGVWVPRAIALLISGAVPAMAILLVTAPTVQTDVTPTVILILVTSLVAFIITGFVFSVTADTIHEDVKLRTVVKFVHVPGPEVTREVRVAVPSATDQQPSGWELVAAFTAGGIVGFATFVYWRVRRWWHKI